MTDKTVPMGTPVAESATPYTQYGKDDEPDPCCNHPCCVPVLRTVCCLHEEANESGSAFEKPACCTKEYWVGVAIKCGVVTALVLAAALTAIILIVNGNTACDASKLAGRPAPNGGHLVPDHVWLEPHETWFGFSQQLDVWAASPPSTTPPKAAAHSSDAHACAATTR